MKTGPKRRKFNDKRRIRKTVDPTVLSNLKRKVRYTGNPQHKRQGGDFGLNPPARPALDKTLCDDVGIFTKAAAQHLLSAGVNRGLISEQFCGEFPQNIWAVTDDGHALEAQLENKMQGTYHGYPVFKPDKFQDAILERWQR